MKRTSFTPQTVALLVALTVSVPSPAFALRTSQLEDENQLAGLEEALDPNHFLEELANAFGLPSSSETPTTAPPAAISPRSAAGMEEVERKFVEDNDGTPMIVEGEFTVIDRGQVKTIGASPCVICAIHLPGEPGPALLAHIDVHSGAYAESYRRMLDELKKAKVDLSNVIVELIGERREESTEAIREIRVGLKKIFLQEGDVVLQDARIKEDLEPFIRNVVLDVDAGRVFNLRNPRRDNPIHKAAMVRITRRSFALYSGQNRPLKRFAVRAAGLEEDRVSKQEAIRLISENPYKATQVSFDNPVFRFFRAEDWPAGSEIDGMLDKIMAADGDAEALFLSIRQVLEHKTIWVRAASVPPRLLAYHRMLRYKINADGIFGVDLFKDGSIFQLSLPGGKRPFYDVESVYLLHYDSRDGLYFLHTRMGEIGQYDMKGNRVHSFVPLIRFVGPVNPGTRVSYQERARLVDTLVRGGGVARVEFTEVPLKSLMEAVDKGYLDFGTITEPGTATFHLNNGGTIILQVMKNVWAMDHVGSAAGLEERVPVWLEAALGADWMEMVTGVHEVAKVTDKVAVLIQPELLGVAGDDGETQVALMSLEGNLHGAFGWSDETTLRFGLLTPQSVEAFEGKGYRVIRVVRHPESEETPLPWEAVPVVVAEALAGGRPTFWVNVTAYLNLKGITLPEILATLTDLFA